MGVRNVAAITVTLLNAGLHPDSPAAAIQEVTTTGQRSFRCTLGTLAVTMVGNHIGSPAVYMIGDVARETDVVSHASPNTTR